MSKSRIPHAFALLFLIVMIATALTWVIPAGQYDRVKNPDTGATYVDPESFHYIEQQPVGLFQMFGAIPRGMIATSEIIFFLFIVGGAFGVIEGTGAFKSGIYAVSRKLKGREFLLVATITTICAIGGAAFGLAEQVLALIPMSVLLATTIGLDRIVAVAMLVVGSQAGFSSGVYNPYTVGVGHKIAELPLFSGAGFRVIGVIVFTTITLLYLWRYCKKIKADPSKSLVADLADESLFEDDFVVEGEHPYFTFKQKMALFCLMATLFILIWGVTFQKWYIKELMYLFFALAVFAGVLGGSGINKTAEDFVKGAQSLTMGALIVGFARGVVLVLGDGMVLDTIIHSLAVFITALPQQIAVLGMYMVQVLINFPIPSGSGQAAATLPIMLPLGDMAGITRQVTIVAMEYGNGLSNILWPTVGLCIGACALAKIPYERWFKWVLPLVMWWHLAGAVMLMVAVAIKLGPF